MKIKGKKISPTVIVSIMLFLVVAIQLIILVGKWLDLKDSAVVLASSVITATGWYFSSHLNHRSFERSEFIKNKDKVISLVDEFFNELRELFEKKDTSIEELEAFVADKTAKLSLKVSQLDRIFNSPVRFLSDDKITKLQNEPIDMFIKLRSMPISELTQVHETQKSFFIALKGEISQEIEDRFEEWLKNL